MGSVKKVHVVDFSFVLRIYKESRSKRGVFLGQVGFLIVVVSFPGRKVLSGVSMRETWCRGLGGGRSDFCHGQKMNVPTVFCFSLGTGGCVFNSVGGYQVL